MVLMVLTAGVATTVGVCTATAAGAFTTVLAPSPRGRAPRVVVAPGTISCGSASGAGTPRAEATMARTTTAVFNHTDIIASIPNGRRPPPRVSLYQSHHRRLLL